MPVLATVEEYVLNTWSSPPNTERPMSCNDSRTLGPIPVWSNKTNNTWLFHPLAAPQSSAGVNFARCTLEVAQSSGAIKVRPAVRYSNDLQT